MTVNSSSFPTPFFMNISIVKCITRRDLISSLSTMVTVGNWKNIHRSGEAGYGEDNKYAAIAYYSDGAVVEVGRIVPRYTIEIMNQAGRRSRVSGTKSTPEELVEWAKATLDKCPVKPILFHNSRSRENEYTLVVYDDGSTSDITIPLL